MYVANETKSSLEGRTLWIPRMSSIGARLFSAVFKSIGIEAQASPPSNERTLELGGLHTSGEECYPEKITLGNFLRVLEENGPEKTAFFMPTANGPCRFGQYKPYLRLVLDNMGYHDVPVISASSEDGYDDLGRYTDNPLKMIRTLWRGLVSGDIARKMLLRTRPYETERGAADAVYSTAIEKLESVLCVPGLGNREFMKRLISTVVEIRDLFRAVPARYTKDKPLIGVVGEIFCRLNTFSNFDAVRKIEAHGGECWLSDIAEWVLYTNWSHRELLKRDRKKYTPAMLSAIVKERAQKADEQKLMEPFREDFTGYEEPHDIYEEILAPLWDYLPADGALGEMVLSTGKSIYLYRKGADGIIDISPFSCMNGIVTESVYHEISRDHERMPIRNFYFDAATSNMERDLDIFMELADTYRSRKTVTRRYPACFD